MKFKIENIALIIASFIIPSLAFSEIPGGAFNTLHVKAKNVDRYVNYIKRNTSVFELVGSDIAGVCVTKSGHQYPGEMFVWNAFESIEAAYVGAQKYDPTVPNNQFEKLREVKYTATFKPTKEFDLRPGHERVWKMKLNDWRAYSEMMSKLETALNAEGHDVRIGVFYPLGGGTEVFHVRGITDSASESGKIADQYFAGAAFGKIWDDSMQYVDEIVSETVEECEIIYTKD
tara:strand:- start:259 stop:951 length:693 start_codon:yes stop_codon:yes gene_type:complete